MRTAAALVAAAAAFCSFLVPAAAQDQPRIVIRSPAAAGSPAVVPPSNVPTSAVVVAPAEPEAPRPRRRAPRPPQPRAEPPRNDPAPDQAGPVFEFEAPAEPVVTVPGALDLRSSPSESGAVVGVAEAGETISVIGRVTGTQGWHAVQRGDRVVFARLGSPTQPATSRQLPPPPVAVQRPIPTPVTAAVAPMAAAQIAPPPEPDPTPEPAPAPQPAALVEPSARLEMVTPTALAPPAVTSPFLPFSGSRHPPRATPATSDEPSVETCPVDFGG